MEILNVSYAYSGSKWPSDHPQIRQGQVQLYNHLMFPPVSCVPHHYLPQAYFSLRILAVGEWALQFPLRQGSTLPLL